jgi:hypothetical protein
MAATQRPRGEVGGGGNGKARWQVGLGGDGKRGDIKYYLFVALFSFVPSRQDAVRRGNFLNSLGGTRWIKPGHPVIKPSHSAIKPSDTVGRGDKTESLGDKTGSPGDKTK